MHAPTLAPTTDLNKGGHVGTPRTTGSAAEGASKGWNAVPDDDRIEEAMADEAGADPRILGTLHAVDGVGLVRLEDAVAAGPDDVWAALTEPSRLADWLGEIQGDLREGGEYRGLWRVSRWEGGGRILVCEPGRRIALVSREDDADHDLGTEITITPAGTGSTIVVEERGMPLEQVAAYGAGDQVHVEDLVAHLAGRGERHTVDRWAELYPGYQALPIQD